MNKHDDLKKKFQKWFKGRPIYVYIGMNFENDMPLGITFIDKIPQTQVLGCIHVQLKELSAKTGVGILNLLDDIKNEEIKGLKQVPHNK